MKFIFTTIISYCLIITSVFAKAPPTTKGSYRSSILINSFVKHYSESVERDIAKYNKIRKDPQSFLKLLPKEDQADFLNLLNQYKIKELPEFKKFKDRYQANIGKNTISFNLVSAFNHKISINEKYFVFKSKDLKKNIKDLEIFINNNLEKSSSIFSFMINQAHAIPLLAVGVVLIGAVVTAYISDVFGESKDMKQQLANVKDDLEILNKQCHEDLPHAGKPEKAKETLSLLKTVLDEDNDLMEYNLGEFFYSNIVKNNDDYSRFGDLKLTNCNDFIEEYSNKVLTSTDRKMVKAGLLDLNQEICTPHEALKECLREFYDRFISSNEPRQIEEFIEDYTPKSNILNNSKNK